MLQSVFEKLLSARYASQIAGMNFQTRSNLLLVKAEKKIPEQAADTYDVQL